MSVNRAILVNKQMILRNSIPYASNSCLFPAIAHAKKQGENQLKIIAIMLVCEPLTVL